VKYFSNLYKMKFKVNFQIKILKKSSQLYTEENDKSNTNVIFKLVKQSKQFKHFF